MDETDQQICTNLRLIGIIKKNQRLRINRNYNIIDVVENTSYSAITAYLWWDTWYYTKYSIKKIFTKDTADLCTKLIEGSKNKELEKIRTLLQNAMKGLNNLKIVYEDNDLALANIDSITEDFISMQINNINKYFLDNDIQT